MATNSVVSELANRWNMNLGLARLLPQTKSPEGWLPGSRISKLLAA
jgi:hypothetical protein